MMPKFRAWHKELKIMRDVFSMTGLCFDAEILVHVRGIETLNEPPIMQFYGTETELMQWTGLQDKSSLYEIYEGDIIDEYGNLAGNIYEDSGLYAQETYWAVTPICCQTWPDTYAELIKRGCHYAK